MSPKQQLINELQRLKGESEWPSPRTLERFPSDAPDEPRWLLGFNFRNPDAQAANTFASLVGLMDKVESVECLSGELSRQHVLWLKHLPALRMATFHSAVHPDCLVALTASQNLQFLTLIGSRLTEEHLSVLQGLGHTQCITLVNCKVDQPELLDMRQHLTNPVMAFNWTQGKQLVPSLPPTAVTCDDPEEVPRIDAALDRIHRGLAARRPIPTNRFSPPLTKGERIALEKKLGLVLPAQVASLLLRHKGQPDWLDKLLCLAPFLEPPGVLDRYQFILDFGWSEFYWFNYRDRARTYHRFLLPLMGADAHTVCLNLLTGQIVELGSYGGDVLAKSLPAFLERLAEEIETGEAAYDSKGRIELRAHTSDLRDKTCPEFSA